MKTTIRTEDGRVTVEPWPQGSGRVLVTTESRLDGVSGLDLSQDQVGVLIFGLEVAAEAARIAADRKAKAEGAVRDLGRFEDVRVIDPLDERDYFPGGKAEGG